MFLSINDIGYIEVKLVAGETVMVDWDESDVVREDNGFEDGGEEYTPEHLLPYVISMEG